MPGVALTQQPEHPERGEAHAEQRLLARLLAKAAGPDEQGEQGQQGADDPMLVAEVLWAA